jgi:hypothetical protein
MNEGQEHLWHIELDYMRSQLRFVLDNLNELSRRNDVKGKIENVYFTLDELCEQTKGERT